MTDRRRHVDTLPDGPPEHRGRALAGWVVLVLLVVLVAVLTVVLAGMLLVVSLWLTVAVPLVVLAAVVGVVAYARRAR